MHARTSLVVGCLGLISILGVLRAQKPFKAYPAVEYEEGDPRVPLPKDWNQPAEWVRARLRYPDIYGYPDHVRFAMRDGSPFPGFWTMDYPRSDRHLLAGIRRLPPIDTRSGD